MSDTAIPIAELLRRRNGASTSNTKNDERVKESKDLEDEIRRLEAELEQSNSDSDSENEFDSDVVEHAKDNNEKAVICLSSVAKERIAPLPESALPKTKRRFLKVDAEYDGDIPKKKSKKEKDREQQEKAKYDGLKDTVQELLQGYVPRSSEKIPFYCRVCQHQSANEPDFFVHKQTDMHKVAVKLEQKATYCKVCRKQLTSPVQMQEHLSSRPHKLKMEYVKGKQQDPNTTNNSVGFKHGRGRTYNEQGNNKKVSNRQWC